MSRAFPEPRTPRVLTALVLCLSLPLSALAVPDPCDGGWGDIKGDLGPGEDDVILGGSGIGVRHGRAITTGDFDGNGIPDIVVAATHADPYGRAEAGEVVVYMNQLEGGISPSTVGVGGAIRIGGPATRSFIGWDLATGDVNGDGFDDLIIGSRKDRAVVGTVWVVDGTFLDPNAPQQLPLGLVGPAKPHLIANIAGVRVRDQFGRSLDVHDMDLDGYADLVVGAPYDSVSGGSVYVFSGLQVTGNMFAADAAVILDGPGTPIRYGFDVAALRQNLTSTGASAHVLVGAHEYDDGARVDTGAVFAYVDLCVGGGCLGSTTLSLGSVDADMTVVGTSPGDWLGVTVHANVSDEWSSTGLSAWVGANGRNGQNGSAYLIYFGTAPTTLAEDVARVIIEGDDEVQGGVTVHHRVGSSFATGDFDGDGTSDVALGGGATTGPGAMWVFRDFFALQGLGSTADVPSPDWDARMRGPTSADLFGLRAHAADLDSDGWDDLLIGAPQIDVSATDAGAVAIYMGGDDVHDLFTAFASYDSDFVAGPYVQHHVCSLPPLFFSTSYGDCDDSDASVHPYAEEVCDLKDNDCDGQFYLGGPVDLDARSFVRMDGVADPVGSAVGFLGDQDGDGDDELVVVYETSTETTILLIPGGNPPPSFTLDPLGDEEWLWHARITGVLPSGLTIGTGDLDGDGVADLVLSSDGDGDGMVAIIRGPLTRGDHAFLDVAEVLYGAPGERLGTAQAIADLDGDGFDDLVVGRAFDAATDDEVLVWYGESGPIFDVAHDAWFYGASISTAIAIGDTNGDGYLDLVAADPAASNDRCVLRRAGDGNRLSGVRQSLSVTDALRGDCDSVSIPGDVNGDGIDDLLVAVGSSYHLVLGDNQPWSDEWFAIRKLVTLDGSATSAHTQLYAGDGDSDGTADMLWQTDLGGGKDGLVLLRGRHDLVDYVTGLVTPVLYESVESYGRTNGSLVFRAEDLGVFEGAEIEGEDSVLTAAGGADFNGDGVPDLAVLTQSPWSLRVVLDGAYGIDLGASGEVTSVHDGDGDGWSTTYITCPMHLPHDALGQPEPVVPLTSPIDPYDLSSAITP